MKKVGRGKRSKKTGRIWSESA